MWPSQDVDLWAVLLPTLHHCSCGPTDPERVDLKILIRPGTAERWEAGPAAAPAVVHRITASPSPPPL